MRQGTCVGCGLITSIRSFYSFEGKTYCEPCVWKASREARESGRPGEYTSLPDNSVCARCGSENAESEFPVVAGIPLCPPCGGRVTNWPYPNWLKISLAFLLLLLAVALVHGRRYFRAGSDMYKGERLVHDGRFADAVPYLQRTVAIAPESDKGVLLLAKAALLTGNVAVAQKAFEGHQQGHFDDADNDDFREVDALWNKAVGALDKAEKASKLAQEDDKSAEAARLMHEAAREYPQLVGLAESAEYLDEGAAFERQDYDGFLTISQDLWKRFPGAQTAGGVASALACKYAVTGDARYDKQAEEMLQKAHELAANDPEQQKSYQEYAERIQYRLKSRKIITTSEYNRRFRAGQSRKE